MVEASYHDITMLEIARRAGLAKGTVYLYFPSKEALFLAVLTRKLEACFATIEAGLPKAARDVGNVAAVIARGLLVQNGLLSLMGLLHSQLEPGAGIEAVVEFKSYIKGRLETAGTAIDSGAALPDGSGRKLLLRGCALAIGLQQIASQPPEIAEAIGRRAPELKGPPMSVESELIDSLSDMIRAVKSSS